MHVPDIEYEERDLKATNRLLSERATWSHYRLCVSADERGEHRLCMRVRSQQYALRSMLQEGCS
jgi:hypothetical protein